MFHSVEIGQASGLATRGDRSRDQAFSAFVSSDGDLVGLVAFALHERQFAEWRAEMARACGRAPTQDEIHAHRLGETTPRTGNPEASMIVDLANKVQPQDYLPIMAKFAQ